MCAYFVPHGDLPLDYFGKFYRSCDPDKWIAKTICNKEIEKAITKGKKAGIKLAGDDFLNPAYWKKHLEAAKMKKNHRCNWRNSFPNNAPPSVEYKKYRQQFDKKGLELLRSVGAE